MGGSVPSASEASDPGEASDSDESDGELAALPSPPSDAASAGDESTMSPVPAEADAELPPLRRAATMGHPRSVTTAMAATRLPSGYCCQNVGDRRACARDRAGATGRTGYSGSSNQSSSGCGTVRSFLATSDPANRATMAMRRAYRRSASGPGGLFGGVAPQPGGPGEAGPIRLSGQCLARLS